MGQRVFILCPMRALILLALLIAAPALAEDQDQAAEALFRAGFATRCPAAFDASGALRPPRRHLARLPEGPALRLWQFACVDAWPRVTGVILVASGNQPPEPIALPVPEVAATFGRAEAPGRRLMDLRITGWRASVELDNPVFDPGTLLLITEGPAPGIANALVHGTYRLDPRGFALQRFDFYQGPATLSDPVAVFPPP